MKTIAPFSLVMLLGTAALVGAQVTGTSGKVPARPAAPAPTAASAPARASAPEPLSADYRLVTGDKLRIEVYKDPQLSQSLQIRPDGKITLPLVGDVAAAGRTSSELRDSIASSLKEYIANPTVTVIVVETVPENIYVMGEVNSPGPQPIKGQLSIMQALATAGGFKDFAKTKQITVLRKTATGGQTRLAFNYNDAVKGQARMLFLQPGDTVIVP